MESQSLIRWAVNDVGGFAVQFAAKEGLTVIGLARAANHDRVRALGAHHVIDYSTEVHARKECIVFDSCVRALTIVRAG